MIDTTRDTYHVMPRAVTVNWCFLFSLLSSFAHHDIFPADVLEPQNALEHFRHRANTPENQKGRQS